MAANAQTTRVRVTIGNFPNRRGILINPMTDETLDELKTGIRRPIPKDKPYEEIAGRKLVRDGSGLLFLPVDWFYANFVEAGREVALESAKFKMSTAKSTKLYRFLYIEEEATGFIPLSNGKPGEQPEWRVDKRRAVIPSSGTATCAIRPYLPVWMATLTLAVRTDRIKLEKIRQLLEIAGEIGLGDFRPDCRGPFGIYEIKNWEILEVIGGNGDAPKAEKAARGRKS